MISLLMILSVIWFAIGAAEAYSFVSSFGTTLDNWQCRIQNQAYGCSNHRTICLRNESTQHSTERRKNWRVSQLEMKLSKGRSRDGKGNTIQEINNLRKRFAGKPGSKNFLDPNKVFIGNLPFDATETHLSEFLTLHLGTLSNVDSFKIIRDWKTGKSKGFGFIQFIEPIYATAAMEMVRNKFLLGRVINLRQGMRKDDDETIRKRQLYVKVRSKGKYSLDKEGSIIESALDEAEDLDIDLASRQDEEEGSIDEMRDDVLMRSSHEEDIFELQDFENVDDSILFGATDDNEEEEVNASAVMTEGVEEYDGDFEEIYGSSKVEDLATNIMNRQRRREAAKRRPKKKLPHKGFG